MNRRFRLQGRFLLPTILIPVALAGQQTKALDPANLDTTCAPCTDFYRFANGGWLARASIPGDQPAWGAFQELQETNFDALHGVLTDAAAQAKTTADPSFRKLGMYYATCMDSTLAERVGVKPLEPELRRIAAVHDRRSLQAAIAHLHEIGVHAALTFRSTQDAKSSSQVIAEAYQGGLGLPDRDYYTKQDTASQTLRMKYEDHLTRMLRLLGSDSAGAARSARAVLDIESALARSSMTVAEQRVPEAVYHPSAVPQLLTLSPTFDWISYFKAVGLVPAPARINVAQPLFLKTLDSLIAHAPIEDWKSYLRWQLVHARAAWLSAPFVTEDFRFTSTALRGISEMRPRWKRCLIQTDHAIGEILGQAYVAKYFTPAAKARALTMVRNIQTEFRSRLASVDWMTDATKTRAYAKLDAIANKIGYPDRWRDYSTLVIESGPFVLNVNRAEAFEFRRDLRKIGRPVDRNEWGMSPPTVNAYYRAQTNEIVFPAGILQPPFYNPQADDAVNYGGMGAVIGHELTHGFDDRGRQFDGEGNLSGWWSAQDDTAFTIRAQVVRRQFDDYIAIDSIHVNGAATLGENIADLGGVTVAYAAYLRTLTGTMPPPIDGLSGPQRFFLAWAQVWRQQRRPEYARLLATVDQHSPPALRVNGPLSNLPEFAQAFGCKSGDPMVRPDSLRARIW